MKTLAVICSIWLGLGGFLCAEELYNGPMGIVQVPDALEPPSPGFMHVYNTALHQYEQGNFDAAANELAAFLAVYPHYSPAVRLLKLVRARQATDPDEALKIKLQALVLPHVTFTDVPLGAAIARLRKQWQQMDPRGEGINIVLDVPPDMNNRPVTLKLRDVTAGDALTFVDDLNGLAYRVEDDAVVVTTRPAALPHTVAESGVPQPPIIPFVH